MGCHVDWHSSRFSACLSCACVTAPQQLALGSPVDPEFDQRPTLVLLNPASGTGKAEPRFEAVVRPCVLRRLWGACTRQPFSLRGPWFLLEPVV
jgi:hypothetical protein